MKRDKCPFCKEWIEDSEEAIRSSDLKLFHKDCYLLFLGIAQRNDLPDYAMDFRKVCM